MDMPIAQSIRPTERVSDSYLRPLQSNLAGREVSEQAQLKSTWEKCMGSPTRPVRYDKTSVLTLSFRKEDDDLDVSKEVGSTATVAV